MSTRFNDWANRQPLARKLTLSVLLTSALSLALACTAFAVYDYRMSRASLVDEVVTAADIAADNSASPLLFQDVEVAERTLATLSHNSAIVGARLFSPDGTPFASWRRDYRSFPEDTALSPNDVDLSLNCSALAGRSC